MVRRRIRLPDQDHADAQDTLDWIAAQDWSNGKVGLLGCSSTAENQLRLGAIGHPALTACVPMSSGAAVGSRSGRRRIAGLLLPRRRPDDQYLGAVARAIRRPATGRSSADAGGDELARTSAAYSVSVPDFRLPDYTGAD